MTQEELVLEIDAIYKGELGQGMLALKNTVGLVDEKDRQKEIRAWQLVVSRILKAVEDGLEVSSEVGRGEFVRDGLGLITPSWNRPPTEPLATKEPWHCFIALHPPEKGEKE